MSLGATIVSKAAWSAIAYLGKGVSRRLIGAEEQRALVAAQRAALAQTIDELADPGDESDIHVADVLGHVFASQPVGTVILDLILERRSLSPTMLEQAAVAAGYETSELRLRSGLHFEAIVAEYVEDLRRQIDAEARRPKSVLFNLVALSAIERLIRSSAGRESGDPQTVRQFLIHYIGDEAAPVGFAGRDDELRTLDAWFTAPSGKPNFFVIGPAGVGKSALMVRWFVRATRLEERGDTAVIFVPISIRYQTHTEEAVFGLLASQVATVYDSTPPSPASARDLREFSLRLLQGPPPDGRKILLIFDGLDEASGWTPGPGLFPPVSTTGHLRILASARPIPGDKGARSWLQRLGWAGNARSITLGGLSFADTLSLLDAMLEVGGEEERLSLCRIVFEKTGGDPLLIGLWVSSLAERSAALTGSAIAELAAMAPDLSGVFQLWWDDQRIAWGDRASLSEAAARHLLSLLATAKGPLRSRDLRRISPDLFPDALSISETVYSLGRFLGGDANEVGYSLCHPRISYYLREEVLDEEEVRSFEGRLLAFCSMEFSDWTRGAPGDHQKLSRYTVRHYASHLRESGADPPTRYELISPSWYQAWSEVLGEMNGFLDDLAEGVALAREQSDLVPQVKAAFILSSLRSQGENMPADLVLSALSQGNINVATAYSRARFLKEAEDRVRIILAISEYATIDQRMFMFEEAYAHARRAYTIQAYHALVEGAPTEYKALICAEYIDLAKRYSWSQDLIWLAHLATTEQAPAEYRAIARSLCLDQLEGIKRSLTGDALVALPKLVEFAPDDDRLFELALNACPYTHARHDSFGFDLLSSDQWTKGAASTDRRAQSGPPRITRGGAGALSSLYKRSLPHRRAAVRAKYLEMIRELKHVAFADWLEFWQDFELASAECADLRALARGKLGGAERATERGLGGSDSFGGHVALSLLMDESEGKKYWGSLCANLRSIDKNYRRYFDALEMLRAKPDDAVLEIALDAAYAETGDDRSRYLTWLLPFLGGDARQKAIADAWEAGLLIDDRWHSGPCLLALECLSTDDEDAVIAALGAYHVDTGLETRDLERSFYNALKLGFADRPRILRRVASWAAERSKLGKTLWLEVFGDQVEWSATDIIAHARSTKYGRSNAELLLAALEKYGRPHPKILSELEALVPDLYGVLRLRTLARLAAEGRYSMEAFEEAVRTASEGARSDRGSTTTTADRFVTLARLLPEGEFRQELVQEALAAVGREDNGHWIVEGYSIALPVVDAATRTRLMDEILSFFERTDRFDGGDFKRVADCLQPSEIERYVALLRPEQFQGEDALEAFIHRWFDICRPTRRDLMEFSATMIERMGHGTRKDAVDALLILSPVLRRVAGIDGVERVRAAVQECRDWWR